MLVCQFLSFRIEIKSLLEIIKDALSILRVSGTTYVVYTYFNSDLYNYEEDYCDITDDYSKIVAE